MQCRLFLLVVSVVLLASGQPVSALAQSPSCGSFDAWVWAQTVHQNNRTATSQLDPDGNDIACDELRGELGFAPAHWTTQIPSNAVTAEITGIVDGDTLEGIVNGQSETIELYRAWTADSDQCGGPVAEEAARQLVALNSAGATVSIEQGDRLRFDKGELLAYIWLTIDGDVYLLNEALVRSGWADDFATGDALYDLHMRQAEQFARTYRLGAWQFCANGPDQNPPSTPAPSPIPTAAALQPTPFPSLAPSQPTQQPSCEPSYPTLCIPDASMIGDLECWQVDVQDFPVRPPDSHHFDDDEDGLGCEPYNP